MVIFKFYQTDFAAKVILHSCNKTSKAETEQNLQNWELFIKTTTGQYDFWKRSEEMNNITATSTMPLETKLRLSCLIIIYNFSFDTIRHTSVNFSMLPLKTCTFIFWGLAKRGHDSQSEAHLLSAILQYIYQC